jgi:hypothetical protein
MAFPFVYSSLGWSRKLVLKAEKVAECPTSLRSVDAVLNQFRSGIRGLYS